MADTLSKRSQLELGLYQEASARSLTLSAYLGELGREGKISEDLFKPDLTNSKGEKLDAFQQLMLGGGIRTKGALAQTGDAFMTDPNNRILFPEFVSREYRDQERQLPALFVALADLVTNREGISGNTHKAGMLSSAQDTELEFGRVAEGAELPIYTVTQAERAIDLFKYGGALKLSYEAVRRVALPMLSRYIGKIARAQVRRKIKRALAVALNGDGNANPAPNSVSRAVLLQFADLIDLIFESASTSQEASLLVADSELISQILMQYTLTTDGRPADRSIAFVDQGGTLPSPLGMTLKLALPGSILVGSSKVMAVDSNDGLVEIYENGSEITESEKLITSQFEVITFSENLGYAKPEANAVRTKTLRAA